MARPPLSEWEDVFGFTEDPTPGDPEILEQLASEYRKVSHDADDAGSVVSRLDSKDLGEGKSMEELRNKLGELPDQVGRLQSSYEKAAAAVKEYATRLRESQEQADKALRDGREAKDRLASAVEVATAAGAKVTGLDNAEAPPPDDEAAKSSARRAMADAKAEQDDAVRSVESAEADLEAARRLALDARELRVSTPASPVVSWTRPRRRRSRGRARGTRSGTSSAPFWVSSPACSESWRCSSPASRRSGPPC